MINQGTIGTAFQISLYFGNDLDCDSHDYHGPDKRWFFDLHVAINIGFIPGLSAV